MKLLIPIIIVLSFISLIIAQNGVGINQDDSSFRGVGVNIVPPTAPPFNNDTGSVNSSDFWDDLDTPADININDLNYSFTNGSVIFSDGVGLAEDIPGLFWDVINNRLGIKTNTPLERLQVGDNGTVNQYMNFQTSNSHERGILYYLTDGTTVRGFVKWDANEDLLLEGDNLFVTFTSSTGRVDIDGNIRNEMIEIDSSIGSFPSTDANVNRIFRTSANGASYPFQEAGHLVLQSRDEGLLRDIVFATGNPSVVRMVVKGTGNVGIKTSTPSVEFDVNGSVNVNGDFNVSNFSDNFLFVDGTTGFVGVNNVLPIDFFHIVGTNDKGILLQTISTSPGMTSALGFKISTNLLDQFVKGAIFFERDSAGNGRGDMHFALDDTTSSVNINVSDTIMTLMHEGRVGILTRVPGEEFSVNGKAEIGILEQSLLGRLGIKSTDTIGRAIHIEESSSGESWQFGVDSSGDLNFFDSTSSISTFTLQDGGNRVGINDNGPDASLEVVGDLMVSSTSGQNGNLFRILSGGNVGVNTTNPTHTLNIFGDSNITQNATFGKDVIINGILYGGSPVEIAGINISNNIFMLEENINRSLDFNIQNLNNGSNASATITAKNDVGGTMLIGIGSSNFIAGDVAYPNMTGIFSRSRGDMVFANFFNKVFIWLTNPSDDNDPNNLVEVMRLDENGLNVTGNTNIESNLTVDTNTLFVDSDNNRVGIGTITPGRNFEVFGPSSVFRFRDSGATASSTTAFIEFGGTDAGVWNRTGWIGDGSSGSLDLSLRAEVGDLLLADSSGVTLTLSGGDATFTGNVGIGNNLTLLFGDLVSEQNPDVVDAIRIKGTNDVDVVLGDIFGTSYFSVWNAADDTAVFFVNNVGNTDVLGDLNIGDDIFMSEDGIIGISASSERILFDGTGGYINLLGANVGIGTTSPTHKLNVVGDGNFTGNLTLGEKITFAFGEVIDNLVDGWLTITGSLNVTGNITSENVFIPSYIFAHDNATMVLASANEWANITFDEEEADIKKGINHTFNDNTNHTFTITQDGIYNIDYNLDVIDTSASSTDIDVAARVIYSNGTEIDGSVFETDITKKNIENELSHSILARLLVGDVLVFQFIAQDVDVEVSTHGTFGDKPESVSIRIEKIANL